MALSALPTGCPTDFGDKRGASLPGLGVQGLQSTLAGVAFGVGPNDFVSFTAFAYFRHGYGFPVTVILEPEGGSGRGVPESGFHGADSRGARRSQRLTLLPLGPFVQRGA